MRDPDAKRARDRARYAADPEAVKARVRAWRAANPEAVRAIGRRARLAHPEIERAKRRAYLLAHPERRRAKNKAHKRKVMVSRRQWLADYKLAAGCADCPPGTVWPSAVLEMDHGTEDKLGNMSQMLRASWEVLVAEAAKCVVLCANHHRMRTVERKDHLKRRRNTTGNTP